MKKIMLTTVNLIMIMLLLGCIDYSDYKKIKIPDDNIGTVKIPNDWEFKLIDGWIHIINEATEEIIGIQWSKGVYYQIGVDGLIYDDRTYNSYFDNFEYITKGIISGNSNGGNYGYIKYASGDGENQYMFLLFNGTSEHSYNIEIILIDNSIEERIISSIAKSYKR